ncbi:MAG: MoaD/ThiS family protein [Pseudanabaena sp. ELA607]
MQVTVKLFAIFQETFGKDEMVLDLPPESNVTAVFAALVAQKPDLQQWESVLRYAVNLEFVSPETLLQEGDAVALIPPVSGG